MSTVPAYPLAWPEGWKRNQPSQRTGSRFGRASRHEYGTYKIGRKLTINEAVDRVRGEIQRIARTDDVVISTNLELRLDGLPRSGQSEPADPGAAVYWRDPRIDGWPTRCMAIDRYDRVADNLAAIAATLEAMRSIERHGGAEILDRVFTGFAALPSPGADSSPWFDVLQCRRDSSVDVVRAQYRRLRADRHPDRGGDAETFNAIQSAWAAFCAERGIAG